MPDRSVWRVRSISRNTAIDFIVIDDNNTVSSGSRAICWAKRTLEIFDRLGFGDAVCERGVSWKVGKVFFREALAYQFDLLPEPGHKRPAFVNLQQYLLEEIMVERLKALGSTVRWKNKAVGLSQRPDGARLEVETPDGRYGIEADYVIAADGAHSAVREHAGPCMERPGLSRPLPDCGCIDARRLSDRTLVLVRPAVSLGRLGVAAQAGQ